MYFNTIFSMNTISKPQRNIGTHKASIAVCIPAHYQIILSCIHCQNININQRLRKAKQICKKLGINKNAPKMWHKDAPRKRVHLEPEQSIFWPHKQHPQPAHWWQNHYPTPADDCRGYPSAVQVIVIIITMTIMMITTNIIIISYKLQFCQLSH